MNENVEQVIKADYKVARSNRGLLSVHRKLEKLVNSAEYVIEEIRKLQNEVDWQTVDQMEVIIDDIISGEFSRYEIQEGVALTKFRYAYAPLHRAIRFNQYPNDQLVRVELTTLPPKVIYTHIATALLQTGIPFLLFQSNVVLVRDKDRQTASTVINGALKQISFPLKIVK